jgi:hypothetical protein
MKTTKTNSAFDFRTMRIFFAPDDGGGDGGAGGTGGSTGGATTIVDTPSTTPDFDPEAAAAAAATPAETPPAIEWEKHVPAELKEKPWMQDILKAENPTERFFKDFEGLQTKLVQRVDGAPKPDAPKEEWDKFYNALGRPETPDGYEFKDLELPEEDKPIGEFIKAGQSDEFIKDVKSLLHSKGLTAKQAQELVNEYDLLYIKHNKEFFNQAISAQKEMQLDYEKHFKEFFGERAEGVQDIGRKLMEETLPAELKPMIKSADSKTLALIAAVLDGVNTKYIKEDGGFNKDTIGTTARSEAEIRAEGIKLMTTPEYNDPTHPQHEAVKAKVKSLYASLPKK